MDVAPVVDGDGALADLLQRPELVHLRADYDSLRYEVIDVPDHVRAGIFRYLDIAGVASSVFDFVIRPGRAPDEWIALEANASGAWGWLAAECGLPIAAAFADTLMTK